MHLPKVALITMLHARTVAVAFSSGGCHAYGPRRTHRCPKKGNPAILIENNRSRFPKMVLLPFRCPKKTPTHKGSQSHVENSTKRCHTFYARFGLPLAPPFSGPQVTGHEGPNQQSTPGPLSSNSSGKCSSGASKRMQSVDVRCERRPFLVKNWRVLRKP